MDDNAADLYRGIVDQTTMEYNNFYTCELDNIQAALKSIRLQEDQEYKDTSSKKKAVTIMSIQEEEALIKQINDIRDRIRRGETNNHNIGNNDIVEIDDDLNEYGRI